MLNTHFHKFDKALSKDFCEYVLRSIDWEKAQTAEIYRGTDHLVKEETRISQVIWQDLLTPIGCVLKNYLLQANSIWNYDLSYIEQAQIAKYGLGGHYDWHIDSKAPINNVQRKLSISILLNDDFEGGGLEFDFQRGENVLKSQGDVVVFPSFLHHRVNPVTDGVRYSAVTWGYGPAFR
jgi:PKHD-type hydroxylase